jgi:hypothetical protein
MPPPHGMVGLKMKAARKSRTAATENRMLLDPAPD